MTIGAIIALAFDAAELLPGPADLRASWASWCVRLATSGAWGSA